MEFLGFLLYVFYYGSIAIVGVLGSILLAVVALDFLRGGDIASQIRRGLDRF